MRRIKRLVLPIVTVVFIALPFVVFMQRQAIFDWLRLQDYTPSQQISALATNTAMTDSARRLFYVYHPSLEQKGTFNVHCENGEQSIVLGCYVGGQGIYIYDVTDDRLNGIEEVTAAHEMLHAAYERLSDNERARIDGLTKQAFDGLTNERVKKSVAAYRAKDPNVVPNELHSIIATEVRSLPPELESYYARYFKDRTAVVALSEKYEQAFTERQQRADAILAELDSLRAEIEALNNRLRATRQELEQEYSTLQAQRSTAEPNAFNARVRAYNARLQEYNASVRAGDALIDKHNALVNEYNSVVLEEKELMQAIDSRLETIEQQ